MFRKPFFMMITVLVLVSMACSVNFNLPVVRVNTGPTVEENIEVPVPDSGGDAHLTFEFGAGELNLEPGAQDVLASGTARYNVDQLKPRLIENGSDITLKTGDAEINGLPNLGNDFVNEWNFALGTTPMDLELNCGAYKGNFELGGLSLRSVRVSDGASDVDLHFSQPNLVEMDSFRYETGASSVSLYGLANANFERMVFKSGAGSYLLDFSGELMRDATITVDTGLSSIEIVVPEGVSARVFVDGGLSNVDIGAAWEKSGNEYTMSGSGPRLTINVNIGAGSLTLSNR